MQCKKHQWWPSLDVCRNEATREFELTNVGPTIFFCDDHAMKFLHEQAYKECVAVNISDCEDYCGTHECGAKDRCGRDDCPHCNPPTLETKPYTYSHWRDEDDDTPVRSGSDSL